MNRRSSRIYSGSINKSEPTKQSALNPFMVGIFFIAPLLLGSQVKVTENVTTDPSKAQFIFKDVEIFVNAHEMLTPECDAAAILQKESN